MSDLPVGGSAEPVAPPPGLAAEIAWRIQETRDLAEIDHASGHLTDFWLARVDALCAILEGRLEEPVNAALARAPQGDPPRAPELQAAMRRLRDSVRYMENDSRDGLSGYESLAADLRIVLDTLDAVPAPQGDAAPPSDLASFAARRDNFHATYNGGWHGNADGMRAFHHGMDTVFNALDKEVARGGASSSGSAPPSDKREADRREAAAFQRGVESVRGAPPNPGDQK